MRKLLQIGSSLNCGAPGKIAEQIGLLAMAKGWDVYMAHGVRHSNPSQLMTIPMVTPLEEKVHALYSLLDRHGLGPNCKTKKLVEWIKVHKPDVIHLHNIHGYFLNYKTLFEYLVSTDIPVVWTLHDCWPFTGHCAYFDSVDCRRWKTGCYECPLKRDYPKSFFIDHSQKNYSLKKQLFAGLKRCVIVPVSDWLGDITRVSFMGKYPVHVIHNGIDLNVFRPAETDLRQRLGIAPEKNVVLGLAAPWVPRKGYHDIIRMSEEKDFQIVMVGVSAEQKEALPNNIIAVTRTSNQQELVEYYNMADVFVNPTYSDNFPTTNLEALACGTPVVTYRTGGSPEAIADAACEKEDKAGALRYPTGMVVEQGDVEGIIRSIRELRQRPINANVCRQRAVEHFDKDKCFEEYIRLYESLIL